MAHGSSHARGHIGATASSLCHSHSNARSLTHWVGPGIKPTSSWILVRFISAEPQQELQNSWDFILSEVRWKWWQLNSEGNIITNQLPSSFMGPSGRDGERDGAWKLLTFSYWMTLKGGHMQVRDPSFSFSFSWIKVCALSLSLFFFFFFFEWLHPQHTEILGNRDWIPAAAVTMPGPLTHCAELGMEPMPPQRPEPLQSDT